KIRRSVCAVLFVWHMSGPLLRAQAPTETQAGTPTATADSTDAQTPAATTPPEPATRAEEMELARRQKDATLWPERENPLVVKANRLVDRGLIEGIQTGQGNNGWQLLLSGTRPAQGQTFGIGYRRSDLFNDVLTARATVRGTLLGAMLVDGELQVNRLRRSGD